MPKIPINGPVYQNVDEMALDKFSPALYDGYLDEAGNTNKRPGLKLWYDLGTGIRVDGLYWWRLNNYLMAVSGGKVFKFPTVDGVPVDITGSAPEVGVRPTFCEDSTYFFMANGGKILHYNNAGTLTAMADADAPTAVSHIDFHDQYLLANAIGSARMHFSDLNDPLNWTGTSYVTAESSPDLLLSLKVKWREIMLLGERSAEIWYDDGSNPFSRMDGAYTERGSGSPHSLIFADNTWFWLDDQRKVVRLNARTPEIVSGPFDKTISGLFYTADCLSDLIEFEGRNFLVFSFPFANRTFVYDYVLKQWYEWSYWGEAKADRERFLLNCSCYAKGWNKWLVGSRIDGKIYELSSEDYSDNGNTIRTSRITGHISHETLGLKESKKLIIKLKRGTGLSSGDTPQMMVRWRDNGSSKWSNEHLVSLGKIGETEFLGKLNRLGRYRTRQYEFALTDSVPLILCEAEEDISVLSS